MIDKLEVNRDQQLTEFQETTPNFPQQSNNLRRVLMVVAILIGLLAVIMGGYYMYNRNQSPDVPQGQALQDSTTLAQDSLATLPDNTRTTVTTLPPDTTLASGFRYVVQTIYGKEQGVARLEEMKRSNSSVQMISNADSSQFRLYIVVPTAPADTTRIKDSLQRIYSNNKVEILY